MNGFEKPLLRLDRWFQMPGILFAETTPIREKPILRLDKERQERFDV